MKRLIVVLMAVLLIVSVIACASAPRSEEALELTPAPRPAPAQPGASGVKMDSAPASAMVIPGAQKGEVSADYGES